MTHICGRHRDGCPKIHRSSLPVEQVGIDARLPNLVHGGGTVLFDGWSLTVKDARLDADLRRFTFTHRGALHEYNSGDRVVREGWLVLPTEAGDAMTVEYGLKYTENWDG